MHEIGLHGMVTVPSMWWAPNPFSVVLPAIVTISAPFATLLGCLEHLFMMFLHVCTPRGRWESLEDWEPAPLGRAFLTAWAKGWERRE